MTKLIKKYAVFLICVFIAVTYTCLKLFVDLGIPSQITTLIMYIPFVICCICAAVTTFRNFKVDKKNYVKNNIDRLLVFLFLIYCVILAIYRYIMHLDYMDGLHFAARIISAFGVYYIAVDSKVINKQITKNLLLFSLVLYLAVIVEYLILKTFRQTAILSNVLIVSGVILLLNLNCIKYLRDEKKPNVFYWVICALNVIMNMVIIFLSGSRAMFVMGIVMLIVFPISVAKNLKHLLLFFGSLIISVIMIFTLFATNFGDSRYMIKKQLQAIHIDIGDSNDSDQYEPDDEFTGNYGPTDQMSVLSDLMRQYLQKKGIEEIRKNPLLGTGHVYFEYEVSKGVIQQTPHNFILEAMIVFGLFGTIFLAVIIVWILVKIFKNKRIYVFNKILCVGVMAIVLGLASFQQALFNYIILSVSFFILASSYDNMKDSPSDQHLKE